MARPKKLTLDFFIHDSDASQDPKIKALRKRFGNDGYAAYFTMLEILCQQKAVLLDLSKHWQLDSIADDCHLRDAAHLLSIIDYCVLVELFDKQIWESERSVCSLGLRDRYVQSLESRRQDAERKGQSAHADVLSEKIAAMSFSFPPGKPSENAGKLSYPEVIQVESTQTTDYRLQTTDQETEDPKQNTLGQAAPDRVSDSGKKSKIPKPISIDIDAAFQAFWSAYPRKVAKQEAYKAYKALITKRTSPEAINKLLGERARFAWLDTEARFIPHAASWLRAEDFTEEVAVVPSLEITLKQQIEAKSVSDKQAEIEQMRREIEAELALEASHETN
jgi:Domain of unknown function (DUF4373)